MWMVRAGQNGRFADNFLSGSFVSLGWSALGDVADIASKADLIVLMHKCYPEMSAGTAASGASQIWRFTREVAPRDRVVTYDGGSRTYFLGHIAGPAKFVSNDVEELTLRRDVTWDGGQAGRDALSDDARNRLGSVLTLFRVPSTTADDLLAVASGARAAPLPVNEVVSDEIDPYAGLSDEAAQRVADRVSRLNWEDMQRLVAALLRAMGYRTEIAPTGPDRGRDIFASPDGFGFAQPRIAVEVKHRPNEKIDAPQVRSFLGGRHKDDRGLYVSTGGFTREAYYEGDRATIPLKLMTLTDLARAVIDNYDRFDNEGRTLLPLTRIYWPA